MPAQRENREQLEDCGVVAWGLEKPVDGSGPIERALRRIQREKKFAHSNLTCQMQDRVRAFRAFLQDLDSFGRRQYLELDFTATSLAVNLFHHWQRSGSSADHKPPALPGYLLLYRERCMPKPIAESFGRFFLALADAATVYHDVIPVSRSVNADRAK